DRREVMADDRDGRPSSDPVPDEHVLDEDYAAEESRKEEADDGRDREQRVAPDVLADHDGLREALRPRRLDVLLAHRVDHPGTDHAQDDAEESVGQGDGRQDEMLERVPEDLAVAVQRGIEEEEVSRLRFEHARFDQPGAPAQDARAHLSIDRQRRNEPDRKNLEEKGEPEEGHRIPGEGDDARHVIGEPVLADRRDGAQGDAEERGEERSRDRQLDGRGEEQHQGRGDGPMVQFRVREAPVSAEEEPEVVDVLNGNGIVEVEQGAGRGDLLHSRNRASQVQVGLDQLVDRDRAAQDKRDQGYADQGGNEQEESTHDEQQQAHRVIATIPARLYSLCALPANAPFTVQV